MANFPLLRANLAAWIGAVDPSEFWALDEGRHKTINAFDGSTHAPSSQIVLGGAGLDVTGPFAASDAELIITTGKEIEVQSGGAVRVESGASLTVENGGALTLGGTTGWPTLGSRTFEVWGFAKVLGVEGYLYTDGVLGAGYPASASGAPAVRTKEITLGPGNVHLEIPLGPNGATLAGLRVYSKGISGHASGTLVRPVYRIRRLTPPDTLSTLATQTDAHASDGSDWTSWIATDITVSSALAKETYGYFLDVAIPYNTSIGADCLIGAIRATYTMTQLRP